jgi:hypothetical protein
MSKKYEFDGLDRMLMDMAAEPDEDHNNYKNVRVINTFLTTYCPQGTAIRVHLNNMIETYGDQEVLRVIKDIFKGGI